MEADNNNIFHTMVVAKAEGKKQILHVHQESLSMMNAMFEPREWLQPRSTPFKYRDLPHSFFTPPDHAKKCSKHFHSKSTGLLDVSHSYQNMVSSDKNQEAYVNNFHCQRTNCPSQTNTSSLNSNNNNNYFERDISSSSMMRHILNDSNFSPPTLGTFSPGSFPTFPTHSVPKRNYFAKGKKRFSKSKPLQSQVVHGRSKSFPELLDMKFESSAAVNPHSKLLAPESYQSKRMKGRDQHGEYAATLEFPKPHFTNPSRWNNQFESSCLSYNYTVYGNQDITLERRDYISNPLEANFQSASDSASFFSETPHQTNSTVQPPSCSFMMRLMGETQQTPGQNNPTVLSSGDSLMSSHRREASIDSGLGLGGLSLTPNDESAVSHNRNLGAEGTSYSAVDTLPVAISNNNYGDTNHVIDQLLDSFSASSSVDDFDVSEDKFNSRRQTGQLMVSHCDTEELLCHSDVDVISRDKVMWV